MSSLRDFEPWTKEQFFAWQQGQSERYELVGGFPLKMMTGVSRRHDRMVVKIIVALERRLSGSPCETFTADGSVETLPNQVRRPDVGIDCGPTGPEDFKAKSPTVVFEVLSPTTRDFDRIRKLEKYKHVPTMRHIVIVEPKFVGVIHVSRTSEDEAWQTEITNEMDRVLALTGAGIELPLSEIYAGAELSDPPKP
ncbi:Uma2 family endonuclease [Fulvimarina sp. MAC3]|uniref:Uma2 family endonuclease n=1 Tax=Fulvimarina sp. MAC3 TaxID=3148887 RepID=UPI0031FCE9FB